MAWFVSAISLFHIILLLVCIKIFMRLETGIALLAIIILAAYLFSQLIIYRRYKYSMPMGWWIADIVIVCIVFLAVLFIGIYFPMFSAYTACTMSLWCIIIILFVTANILFARDEA